MGTEIGRCVLVDREIGEDLGGAYFQVSNPNDTSLCSRGSSFSI